IAGYTRPRVRGAGEAPARGQWERGQSNRRGVMIVAMIDQPHRCRVPRERMGDELRDSSSQSCAGLTRASIFFARETLRRWMDCGVKPGNDDLKWADSA